MATMRVNLLKLAANMAEGEIEHSKRRSAFRLIWWKTFASKCSVTGMILLTGVPPRP